MSAFAEVQFPPDIAFGSSGGPQFSTDISESIGGVEIRNSNWSLARARYNVASGAKTPAQMDALNVFFRARRGKAQGFRFKDWADFQASAQAIGTGNGSRTQFQLCKWYENGGVSMQRPILKPVSGTVLIYKNGVLQTTGISTNTATGVVAFITAPSAGAAITASFEFDVPVRFDTDQLEMVLQDVGVRQLVDVPLVELRIEPTVLV